MPSSACVTDRFAGARRVHVPVRSSTAPSTSSVCWPTAGCGPCTAGVGAPCNRNEMPAWRTGPCTGSSTTTDIPLLITCSSSSASCAWRTGAIAISLAQNWSSRSWRFIAPDRVADHVVERLAAGRVPFEVGRVDAQDLPDDAAVLAPTAGEVHRVHPQAVGALVDAGPRLEPDLEPRLDPVLGVLPQLRGEREHALVQRRLHPLPAPGELARVRARRGSPPRVRYDAAMLGSGACRKIGPSRKPGCSYCMPERACTSRSMAGRSAASVVRG